MKKYIFKTAFGTVLLFLTGLVAAPLAPAQLTNIELLGKYVFFDKISSPKRMACVTCHDPATGGTGSVSGVNLHQVAITGANPHTVGNLKPPTNAYASLIPPFQPCAAGIPLLCGGNFWNGRAEGNAFGDVVFPGGATRHIGDEIFYTTEGTYMPDYPGIYPNVSAYSIYFGGTADQALNPMPNPVEQNIDRQGVCRHVASSKYAKLYKLVWGVDIDCSDTTVTISAPDMDPSVNPFADPLFFPERAFDISFKRLMLAVCAWQASDDLNSFSSKRDIALAADADGKFHLDGFTAQENLGHDLFYNRLPVPFIPEGGFNVRPFPDLPITNCSFCHMSGPSNVAPGELGTDPEERYTDDAYHNIGTPPNPEIPGYPVPNAGLAGHTGIAAHSGFHKTPTLRNVDKRKGKGFIKAYTHNGWFKSMESIVHFYNTAFIGNPANGKTLCPEGTTEKNALKLSCWPAPEQPGGPGIPAPPIPILLGNLGLTPEQEAAIVAYLKTLTDTYTPKAPKPYK